MTNTPPGQTYLVIQTWEVTDSNSWEGVVFPGPIVGPIIGPIFPLPTLLGDWDPRFALPPGVNGEVLCTATIGTEIYFGGRFDRAGTLVSGGLLRWDGKEWSTVGDGIQGEVHALAAYGNSLYVGGSFRTLGNVSATNIARWTRSGWQSLGGGIAHTNPLGDRQYVSAILPRGRAVYVGGNFRTAGGVSAINVAKWDGRQWSPLGDGIGHTWDEQDSTSSEVHALEWCHGSLYAGGRFSSAGLNEASNLARWNGRRWFADNLAVGGPVYTLARQGTDLLVGGNFAQISDLALTNLARWNGRRWAAIGGGVHGAEVRGLLVHGARVYVAGSFERAGPVETANVACWNGRRWTNLTSGVRGFASALGLRQGRLYVGGYFGLAGGVPASFVARWHRETWFDLSIPELALEIPTMGSLPPVTNAVIGEVMAVAAQGSNAYVGGRIFSAGLLPVNNIAQWNGTRWSDLGGGIPDGIVTSIAVDGSNVYVGGSFTLPAIHAHNLAHWNGVEWRPLHNPGQLSNIIAQPIPGYIDSLAASHGKLRASGLMTIGLQVPSGYTAEWDGTNWSLILTERGHLSTATVMVADTTNFFGVFDPHRRSIRHRTYSDLIRWDGTEWSSMTSSPITGAVHAITLQHSNLFLAGKDIQIESLSDATDLLRWDGNAWSAIEFAPGDGGKFTGMAATRDWLYVAGTFSPSGSPTRSVARWNGSSWSSLNFGIVRGNVPDHLDVIQATAGDGMAYFAGNIRETGGRPAFNFAVWNESLWPIEYRPPRTRGSLPRPTSN